MSDDNSANSDTKILGMSVKDWAALITLVCATISAVVSTFNHSVVKDVSAKQDVAVSQASKSATVGLETKVVAAKVLSDRTGDPKDTATVVESEKALNEQKEEAKAIQQQIGK